MKNINLLVAIARRGLPQREVAHRANVGVSTLSRLVCRRGKSTPQTAKRLARVLGRPVSALGLDLWPREGGAR